jgi:hypothetical protein
MNWRDTKLFITNWNQLETGFRELVDWFLTADMKVTVFDNASSYPPLLEYYDKMAGVPRFDVKRLPTNRGCWVFWQDGYNTVENTSEHFITSDADCPPDADCPKDLVEKMIAVLEAYPTCRKVSPRLRTDNLPDCYDRKADAICNQAAWFIQGEPVPQIEGLPKLFHSHTDTTLTMWRAGNRQEGPPPRLSTSDWGDEQYRMEYPYALKHAPWYQDSKHPSAEVLFYRNSKENVGGQTWGL